MTPDPNDTIVALCSASGGAARAIVRLSGPDSLRIAQTNFTATDSIDLAKRRFYSGLIRLPDIHSGLPADLYVWPAPRTYTGQQMAELHTLSVPPLLEVLVAQLLNAGARAAQPGEFSLRAFLAGKRDLPRAEAVQAVVSAGSRHDLRHALAQLAGGVTRPLEGLREDLMNLLADVEAALDFAEEDIEFVGREDLLHRLAKGLAQVTILRRQLEQRSAGERGFRAVLVGAPNVGKSSLFNALSGAKALVSPIPGTTRDYLVKTVALDAVEVELIDTAGWRDADDTIESQSQALGRVQAQDADLVLFCADGGADRLAVPSGLTGEIIRVSTKCDIFAAAPGSLATSAVTGLGLGELKMLLAERARSASGAPALAPSLSRCRHAVDACLVHLRSAHTAVLFNDPGEILALELRGALAQLGELVGAVYTDDLLDRIFSRFCIGK
jgi:tRNA modification GTPase